MNNPDSRAEKTALQMHDFFVPQEKKPTKDEHYASVHDVFPQKSIKWRSPLVHSPAGKFLSRKSEFVFNFGGSGSSNKEDTRGSGDLRLGSQDTNTSSMNSTSFEIMNNRMIHSNAPVQKPPKKKIKFQFPLSDQDCPEKGNVSFNTELKELSALCDPEYFGLSTRPKQSTPNSSQSYAGKYYSNILMNSQHKRDQYNLTADEASYHSKSRTRTSENKLENVPESAAREPRPKEETIGNIPPENNFKNMHLDTKSFTQAVPLDYCHDPTSKLPRGNCLENKSFSNNIHFAQKPNLDDSINTSFNTFPNPKYPIEYSQKYLSNSHLNEQSGYPVLTSPYFSEHFHESPVGLFPHYAVPSPQHPCLCCGHHKARYPDVSPFYEPCLKPITELHSNWNHVDRGLLHRAMPTYSSRIVDVPGDYHYLNQRVDQSWRFAPDINLNNLATSSRDFPHYDNSLSNLFARPSLNPTQEGNRCSYASQPKSKFEQVGSYKPTSEHSLKKLIDMHHSDNQFHEPETSRRNVSHNRPGFNLIRNRKPLAPRESYFHSSLPPSMRRRMLNFNSFEERLDNIIVHRSSGFSFSATRDQKYDHPTNFDPSEQVNRFVLPSHRKGTQ